MPSGQGNNVNEMNWRIPTGRRLNGMPFDVMVEKNCVMPDNCSQWDDPVMKEPLLPLSRFDRPALRRTPERPDQEDARGIVSYFIRKHCAGLNHDLRVSEAEFRAALRAGVFDERFTTTLEWALTGMPRTEFPDLFGRGGIAIYDMVRCFWTAFDGAAFTFAPWLNQWGHDPSKPPPAADYEYHNFPLTRAWVKAGRPPVWPPVDGKGQQTV